MRQRRPSPTVLALVVYGGGLAMVAAVGLAMTTRPGPPVLSVDEWGTVADWATAILPGAALILTGHLWMRDRQLRDEAAQSLALRKVTMIGGVGGVTILKNQSGVPITLTRGEPTEPLRSHFPPGTSAIVATGSMSRVEFQAFERCWSLVKGGEPSPVHSEEPR